MTVLRDWLACEVGRQIGLTAAVASAILNVWRCNWLTWMQAGGHVLEPEFMDSPWDKDGVG
jgi:hypothetical protein